MRRRERVQRSIGLQERQQRLQGSELLQGPGLPGNEQEGVRSGERQDEARQQVTVCPAARIADKHGSRHEDPGETVVAVSLVSATDLLEPETQVRPGVETRAAVGALATGISRRGAALRRARAQALPARARTALAADA